VLTQNTYKMEKNTNAVNDEGVVDVRQTMEKLPLFLNWLLTWLTGKPLKGQQPFIKRSNLSHLVTAHLTLFGGIVLSVLCSNYGLWWFIPLGWLFTVSGARKLVTTINHYCVHKDLLPSSLRKKYSRIHSIIADINSSIVFLQDFAHYQKEHLTHHGDKIVASILDPDMVFMWLLGLRAGMSKSDLWKKLLFNLFFPFSKLHRLFLVSRFNTTLFKGNPLRYTVHSLVLLALVYLGMETSFSTVFWTCIFPMTYLYHIASLLQFSTEHLWLNGVEDNGLLKTDNNHKFLMNRAKRITSARFCGEPFPKDTGNMFTTICKRMWWCMKMLFVHLSVRLFVLPGDLVVHDWHHRCGHGDDWANAFYSRQQAMINLKADEPPYMEVWGLKNAINRVFENLSQMAPIHPDKSDFHEDDVLGM
jgi:hypothetical protein